MNVTVTCSTGGTVFGACGGTLEAGEYIRVTVDYLYSYITPLPGFVPGVGSDMTLHSESEVRFEGSLSVGRMAKRAGQPCRRGIGGRRGPVRTGPGGAVRSGGVRDRPLPSLPRTAGPAERGRLRSAGRCAGAARPGRDRRRDRRGRSAEGHAWTTLRGWTRPRSRSRSSASWVTATVTGRPTWRTSRTSVVPPREPGAPTGR